MKKCKYTFFYIVGGPEVYYDQLALSLSSLKRLKVDYRVKILDVSKKLNSEDNIEIIHIDTPITQKHIFWQYKYFICQQIDTKYGIYLDCDTVICYDRVEELCKATNNLFGVVPHFYVQNFKNYLNIFYSKETAEYYTKYQLKESDTFYTGGVFFFSNNQSCKNILKRTFELHDEVYSNKPNYCEGLYDETFLSTVLKDHAPIKLNGSVNHCSANLMPIKIENKVLLGKNPQDSDYEPIFALHGSSTRQKQAEDFEGELKQKIINFWN